MNSAISNMAQKCAGYCTDAQRDIFTFKIPFNTLSVDTVNAVKTLKLRCSCALL